MDLSKQNVKTEEPKNLIDSNSEYIKLISSDNHEFIIKRSYAYMSGTIKTMLETPGFYSDKSKNEIHFKEISSQTLEVICNYLSTKAISDFSTKKFKWPKDINYEILMAANFLDC